jgi:fructokinase
VYESAAYITVGTGVGVGLVVNNKTVHGLVHPEMGHISVPRAPHETLSRGVCPYHESCVEGYVCSAALAKRFNVKASELASTSDDDDVRKKKRRFFIIYI